METTDSNLDVARDRLIAVRKFEPLESEFLERIPGGFLVSRIYAGAPVTIAGLLADRLSPEEMEALAADFDRLSVAQLPRFENMLLLHIDNCVGQIWFFFRSGCPQKKLDHIRGLKRQCFNTALLPWVFDLAAAEVHFHKGLPWMRWPGRGFTRALARDLAREIAPHRVR